MFNVKRGDITAFTFLTVAVMVIFMFETIIVKPYLDEQGYTYVNFHLCIGLMILFNVYASLYRLVSTDTSTVGLVMPSTRPNSGDWRYCLVCEANSPPRAYHCRNCDRCILRRDHHCIFSGKFCLFLFLSILLIFKICSLLCWTQKLQVSEINTAKNNLN